jgi:C1A family cysteine protease
MNPLDTFSFVKTWIAKMFAPEVARLPHEVANIFLAKVQADNVAKSLDDDRDFMFIPTVDPTNIVRSNNRQFSSRIENQLTLGSCTGNSTSTACESIENQGHGYIEGVTDLSRLFVYQTAQKIDGLTGDIGATIRSALKGLKQYGAPRESDYPYLLNQYGTEPGPDIIAKASAHKLVRYEKIEVNKADPAETHYKLQSALAEGLRVVMGFDVQRWMFYITGPLATHINQPGPLNAGDPMLDYVGKHAIYIEDFDRTIGPTGGGSYIAVNSWGTGYADNGRWAFPKVMLMNYAYEFWVIREFADVKAGGPVAPAPLTQAQIAEGRQWLVNHGIGYFDTDGTYMYSGAAPVGNFVAAGAAKRAGYTPEQYAEIIRIAGPEVRAFMDSPANQNLINAYAT